MQPRNEAARVDLLRAARAMGKADDLRAGLFQADAEAQSLRVVDERAKSFPAVTVIAHQDGELAAWRERLRAVADELLVTVEKVAERRSRAHVAQVIRVDLLPPLRRMNPNEV